MSHPLTAHSLSPPKFKWGLSHWLWAYTCLQMQFLYLQNRYDSPLFEWWLRRLRETMFFVFPGVGIRPQAHHF